MVDQNSFSFVWGIVQHYCEDKRGAKQFVLATMIERGNANSEITIEDHIAPASVMAANRMFVSLNIRTLYRTRNESFRYGKKQAVCLHILLTRASVYHDLCTIILLAENESTRTNRH